MRKLFVLLAASLLVMVVGFASTVANAAEGKDQTKVGIVKKVDAAAKQIVVMVTRELAFTATDNTKITKGDEPAKFTDIKIEDKVSVTYVKDGDTRTASKIAIVKEK